MLIKIFVNGNSFDQQICQLSFESWLYTTDYQQFVIATPAIRLVKWSDNDQWLLTSTSSSLQRISYEVESEFFDRVVFTLVLQRRIAYYTINVIIPSIIIAFVELVIFMLPVSLFCFFRLSG